MIVHIYKIEEDRINFTAAMTSLLAALHPITPKPPFRGLYVFGGK